MAHQTLLIHGLRWRAWHIPKLPPYWVPITPPGGLSPSQRVEWTMVLAALRIPYWITVSRRRPSIVVPCLLARVALGHIGEVADEPRRRVTAPEARPEPAGHPVLSWLLLLPVVLAHALRWGNLPLPAPVAAFLPATAADWPSFLGLDTVRVRIFHEFQRCVTALLCHADAAHLAGNTAFSALFLHFLARAVGPGAAILLTLLGGALGNAVNAFAHREYVLSIGFSTALFSCVGALSGCEARRSKARVLLPLAGGGGLLAMLGAAGENTDYTAHVCGLLTGMALGLLWAFAEARWPCLTKAPAQWACGLSAAALLTAALAIAL